MEDPENRWRTPETSWLDMEEAMEGEVLVINMMRAEEDKPPRCLTEEEEFQVWREQKESETKKKIDAGDSVVEHHTKEEEQILW
jgi:hypothetical protein